MDQSSIGKILKKEKGTNAGFALIPQTEEIITTVHGEPKVKKDRHYICIIRYCEREITPM